MSDPWNNLVASNPQSTDSDDSCLSPSSRTVFATRDVRTELSSVLLGEANDGSEKADYFAPVRNSEISKGGDQVTSGSCQR